MRAATQRRIDALHVEIARLVKMEQAYHDKKHPDDNKLWRNVAHAQIEVAAWPPGMRNDFQLQGQRGGITP